MMLSEINGPGLKGAVKNRAKFKPIIFRTISLVAIGLVIAIFGAVIVLIDNIEMGPPQYDSQYERHAGSSLAHIMGRCTSRSIVARFRV